jgi:hypothetical protein
VLVNVLISLTIGLAVLTPIIVIIVDVLESKKRVDVDRQSYYASLDREHENYWREYL